MLFKGNSDCMRVVAEEQSSSAGRRRRRERGPPGPQQHQQQPLAVGMAGAGAAAAAEADPHQPTPSCSEPPSAEPSARTMTMTARGGGAEAGGMASALYGAGGSGAVGGAGAPSTARSCCSTATLGTQRQGTARSIAASEWAAVTAPAGAACQPSEPGGGDAAPQAPLLRRSVGTQCSDPAAPPWMSYDEAVRVRAWCDEPAAGNLAWCGSAASGGPSVASSCQLSPGVCATTSAAAATGSGLVGPSLGDDVLSLLGAVLVGARHRPSAEHVAQLVQAVLARHEHLEQQRRWGAEAAAAAEALPWSPSSVGLGLGLPARRTSVEGEGAEGASGDVSAGGSGSGYSAAGGSSGGSGFARYDAAAMSLFEAACGPLL